MPQQNNSAREQLQSLEKIVKKIIRNSLKNNTLEYVVQITTSSLDPKKLKYAAHISSPSREVQDVTFVYDSYDELEMALKEAQKSFSPQKVEIAFHASRINSYESKVLQHKQRIAVLESPNYDPETDGVSDMEKKDDSNEDVQDNSNS